MTFTILFYNPFFHAISQWAILHAMNVIMNLTRKLYSYKQLRKRKTVWYYDYFWLMHIKSQIQHLKIDSVKKKQNMRYILMMMMMIYNRFESTFFCCIARKTKKFMFLFDLFFFFIGCSIWLSNWFFFSRSFSYLTMAFFWFYVTIGLFGEKKNMCDNINRKQINNNNNKNYRSKIVWFILMMFIFFE